MAKDVNRSRSVLVAWTMIICLSVLHLASTTMADLDDSDWDTVNAALRAKRNAAGTNTQKNTQCSAAGVCLEVSKWLYEINDEAGYRVDLINKADEILDMGSFGYHPWAFHDSSIGITVLATEYMAYLFRHDGTDHVFLDSVYYYDASLGGSSSDHTERQRLFVRPSTNKSRYLWRVVCATSNQSNTKTLYSDDVTGMSTPEIGGVNGQYAWVKFTWNDITVPGTDRHIKVKAKIEVYKGNQSISGISKADNTHGAWWINVKHISGDDVHIWQVDYPIIERLEKFHRFSDDAYICLPKQAGAEQIVGQVDNGKFGCNEYPGGIEFQMAASYQRNAGLIYYCDDKEGYRKALVTEDKSSGTLLTWRHYPKMQGHSSARVKLMDSSDLDYACRIGVFKGDWYDAAVWLRENWLDNSYAGFLPGSLRGGWLLDAHHGTYSWEKLNPAYQDWLDSALDTHFPGTSNVGSHSAYKWRKDYKPQSTTYDGQWIYEPWIEQVSQNGRDFEYDPIPGSHYQAVDDLKDEHNVRTIFYGVARLMCKLFHNDGEHPDSPHYTEDGDVWKVLSKDGSQPYIPQWQGSTLVGNRGYVCPAASGWRDFLSDQVKQMVIRADAGNDSRPWGIYLDVACTRPDYGGPCYNTSSNHGHPDQRGGGNHYAQGTIDLLNDVRDAGRYNNNNNFVVISEGNADIWLNHIDSYVHFSMDDDIKHVPISHVLWAHRVRSYGDKAACKGWGSDRTRVKTARAFVYGVAMGRINETTFNDNGRQLRAIKTMVNYRRTFFDFLAEGKMYRPPETNKSHNVILTATWKSGDDVLFAVANGTNSYQNPTVTFDISQCGVSNPQNYTLYEADEYGNYTSVGSFSSSGVLQKTFWLNPLGDNGGDKGVLCYVAEN